MIHVGLLLIYRFAYFYELELKSMIMEINIWTLQILLYFLSIDPVLLNIHIEEGLLCNETCTDLLPGNSVIQLLLS